ncbi:MAG TPA: FxsA family protein [Thermoleophilaceae bacterium]|nr:FxsA family protein [Thermoleophilaceae bacterium]
MPLLALIALFIALPLLELYVILKVGDAIGAVWTIVLLAADSVLGSLLLRSQGRSVWRRFNNALAEGKMPHREVMDGVLVIFGGAFLITPGFVTDFIGLLLLLPPTRAVIRSQVVRRLGRRVAVGVATRPGRHRRRDYDVEGTAREHDDAPPGLER